MRIQDRNNFAGTKVSAEGRCSRYRAKISLQLWEDRGEADVPLQSTEVRMEVHRSIGGPYARVSGCPREAVTLWGSPPWSTLAGGICDLCRGVTLEHCVPEGLYPMGEQFMNNCSLWEGLSWKNFVEGYLSWEGLHIEVGEECEEQGDHMR